MIANKIAVFNCYAASWYYYLAIVSIVSGWFFVVYLLLLFNSSVFLENAGGCGVLAPVKSAA